MILIWLIMLPIGAGLASWLAGRFSRHAPRWVALFGMFAGLLTTIALWVVNRDAGFNVWFEQVNWNWSSDWGIRFHLAMDGLSLLLIALTYFLGVISVLVSWTEIQYRIGFFHLCLQWIVASMAGVFLSIDLFLFYFSWELMLVPLYFLIAIWGHERRIYASVKFFIFTQLSGLLMLIAILSLYFVHHAATGVYTFEYEELLGTPMAPSTQMWIMLGFFVAFAVKLPVPPLHSWLPDAHTEAPTAGSVDLAGLVLKTGAYGMLRFVVPLFPEAARAFAPIAMALGIAGVLYGAILAFSQTDMKRLVAWTSVSHMGFVLLGIFAWNSLALEGVMITMIAHGISTGALFVIVGMLQERLHTRELNSMSGLWTTAPRLGGATLLFALASLGLPGLGDFAGEFLVLLGTYRVSPALAICGAIGVLAATFYALRMIERAFRGPNTRQWRVADLVHREGFVVGLMIGAVLWLGLYPQPVINMFRPAMTRLETYVSGRFR
jgi:NADH-quinone oxidoreductase subunit M